MSDDVISSGPFKGSKVIFASSDRIEEFHEISNEFMFEIFEFLPGDYLISDESSLLDFDSSDAAEIWNRITTVYGFTRQDVNSELLVDIFSEIVRRQNQH